MITEAINWLLKKTINKKIIIKNINEKYFWAGLNYREVKRIIQYDCFLKTNSLEGDIVELGVASGDTLVFWGQLNDSFGNKKKILAYDTFEGFPKGSIHDGAFNQKKKNSYKNYTIDFVKDKLNKYNINTDYIKLIKGRVPESLEGNHVDKVSLVNLDFDIHEPISESLNFFYPRLENEGIILLDEYDFHDESIKWPGAKKSIDKFCMENDIKLKTHFTGRKYIQK